MPPAWRHLEGAAGVPHRVGELGEPAQAVPDVAGAVEGGATPALVQAGELAHSGGTVRRAAGRSATGEGAEAPCRAR